MVYRRCLQLLRDDAEASDLMQDVFLRIYSASERLDMDSPSSLLWNTATRLCLNRIRDKRRRGLDVDSSSLLLSIACAEDETSMTITKRKMCWQSSFRRNPNLAAQWQSSILSME